MTKLVIMGAGNMARTLIQGWEREASPMGVAYHVLARSRRFEARGWEAVRHQPTLDPEVLAGADAVLLTVKPADIGEALSILSEWAPPGILVASMAAGIALADLKRQLALAQVARLMPNIGVAVGSGVVAIAEPEPDHAAWPALKAALGRLGALVVVPEPMIDAVTAVSGSGPAYAFVLLGALEEAAVAMGVPAPLARELAARTLTGAAALSLAERDRGFGELTAWVASPGGTTEAALAVLDRANVGANLREAIVAAGSKARTLGAAKKEIGTDGAGPEVLRPR